MPHIVVSPDVPGILGLLKRYPETGAAINRFTVAILRGDPCLSAAERELIATYVSARNECTFCTNSHAAVARELYGDLRETVDAVLVELETAPISDRMKALLRIAGKVQRGGRYVTKEDIDRALAAGADDRAVHDTVLIAAAFCMFNRYVDGLATTTPDSDEFYQQIGKHLAAHGYDGLQSDGSRL